MKCNIKALAVGLITAALVLAGASRCLALDDQLTLTVTISNAVSVNIISADYDFGDVALGATTISTLANIINVDNTSGGVREDYALSMVDNHATWGFGAAAGNETYAVWAIFNSAQPVKADFVSNDNLTGSNVLASVDNFGIDSSGDGFDVVDIIGTHEKTLWLRLDMPTASVVAPGAAQSAFATITLTATAG